MAACGYTESLHHWQERVGVQGMLFLTLHLSTQMAAVTTGSGQISEIIWEESIYYCFEITDDV